MMPREANHVHPTRGLGGIVDPVLLVGKAGPGLGARAGMEGVGIAGIAEFPGPDSAPGENLGNGPGRYRFVDYIKLGVPLTLVVFVTVMVLLPILWPLAPLPG